MSVGRVEPGDVGRRDAVGTDLQRCDLRRSGPCPHDRSDVQHRPVLAGDDAGHDERDPGSVRAEADGDDPPATDGRRQHRHDRHLAGAAVRPHRDELGSISDPHLVDPGRPGRPGQLAVHLGGLQATGLSADQQPPAAGERLHGGDSEPTDRPRPGQCDGLQEVVVHRPGDHLTGCRPDVAGAQVVHGRRWDRRARRCREIRLTEDRPVSGRDPDRGRTVRDLQLTAAQGPERCRPVKRGAELRSEPVARITCQLGGAGDLHPGGRPDRHP